MDRAGNSIVAPISRRKFAQFAVSTIAAIALPVAAIAAAPNPYEQLIQDFAEHGVRTVVVLSDLKKHKVGIFFGNSAGMGHEPIDLWHQFRAMDQTKFVQHCLDTGRYQDRRRLKRKVLRDQHGERFTITRLPQTI